MGSSRKACGIQLVSVGLCGSSCFLSTTYVLRKLTLEGYGIYALLTSLVGYYGMLDLGVGQAVTKFVAGHSARGDTEEIGRSINAAIGVQGIAGAAASMLMLLLAEQILTLFGFKAEYRTAARAGLYASSIGFLFTVISG